MDILLYNSWVTVPLLAAVTFVLRVGPRWWVRGLSHMSDVWYHLEATRQFRLNGHRKPDSFRRFLFGGSLDYPYLYYWLWSFAPERWLVKLEPYSSALWDVAQAVLVYFAAAVFAASAGHAVSPNACGALAGLIFAFTPVLAKADARTFAFSPRAFGGLLATLSFYYFGLAYIGWNGGAMSVACLLVASFWCALICLASKFSVQTVVFGFAGLAIGLGDWRALQVLPAGFALALCFSRGDAWHVLKAHVVHSVFYCKVLSKATAFFRSRKGAGELLRLPALLRSDPKQTIRFLYEQNAATSTLAKMPWLILLAYFVATDWQKIVHHPALWFLFVLECSLLGATILTSLRALWFLGEAERYQENGAFPVSILCAYFLLLRNSAWLWAAAGALLLVSECALALNYWIFTRQFGKGDADAAQARAFLNSLPSSSLLAMPMTHAFDLAWHTSHNVAYWTSPNYNFKRQGVEGFHRMFGIYPMPHPELQRLAQEYGVDLLYVDKQALAKSPDRERYDLSQFQTMFENDGYAVLKLR